MSHSHGLSPVTSWPRRCEAPGQGRHLPAPSFHCGTGLGESGCDCSLQSSGTGAAMPTGRQRCSQQWGALGTYCHPAPLGEGGPGAGLVLSVERCGGLLENREEGTRNGGIRGVKRGRGDSLHAGKSLFQG